MTKPKNMFNKIIFDKSKTNNYFEQLIFKTIGVPGVRRRPESNFKRTLISAQSEVEGTECLACTALATVHFDP